MQEQLPVAEREPQDSVVEPGQELAKHRVRVSFDFDVTVNSEPVANESYDEGGSMDMALLKSFLVANKGKLLMMMVDAIGQKLGMHSCETFMHEFLPQVNIESKGLFGSAIEALEGDERQYWREIRDEPDTEPGWGDYITVQTEELFKCFSAEFAKSSYEVVEDKPKVICVHNYIDNEAIKDTSQLLKEKGKPA
jgi:hypothetical protein